MKSRNGITAVALLLSCGIARADNAGGSGWLGDGPIYETHPYYYDGTFKAVTMAIPSIAELGVKTIYLMPIWECQRGQPLWNHIYLINDYYKIDPAYGTPEDLRELVATVHKHGLKILFDLVTTATPPGSVVWNNGWVHSVSLSDLKKLVPDLQEETRQGTRLIYRRSKSDDARAYDVLGRIVGDKVVLHCYPNAFWGPAVDVTHPDAIKYFADAAAHYVKQYDIDGWRVDAPNRNWNPEIVPGDHSTVELLRRVKKAICAVKPDAALFAEGPWLATINDLKRQIERSGKSAEALFGERPWLAQPEEGPVLDEMHEASYSYFFRFGLPRLKTSEQLVRFFTEEQVWHARARARLTESHDLPRTARVAPSLSRSLLVLISTVPGIPMIQAGQEIGATNEWFNGIYATPPGATVTVQPRVTWDSGDRGLRQFCKKVFTLRAQHDALKYGSIKNVWKSGGNTYAYVRSQQQANAIVVVSLLDRETTSTLDISFLSKGTILRDELAGEEFVVDTPAAFTISLPAQGSRILFPTAGGAGQAQSAPGNEDPRRAADERLARVKVASLYENVTDHVPSRSLADVIKIFQETHTDLVWRGFWAEWFPTPDSPDNIPPELRDFFAELGKLDPAQVPAVIRRDGFYYDRLRDCIAAVKREMPNLIFIGSFPAQRITRVARNPITGKVFSTDETWRIALGPEKWKLQREGKPLTKQDFQTWFAKSRWTTDQSRDDPRKLEAYFPDITNPGFQELLVSWAKKQLDCGADGVWIDGLEAQPLFLYMITDDPAHPAVKESFAACAKVVDAIHQYGRTKGKHVYVASWARPHVAYLFRNRAGSWDDAFARMERIAYPSLQLDFVTLGPLNDEVLARELDKAKWEREMVSIRKCHGTTPVFAFLDWGFNESQTVHFSQELSKEEQRSFLKTLDAAYAKMGIDFVYPIRGGYMGRGEITKRLAFGKQRIYDSLAPEFETYETINELARRR